MLNVMLKEVKLSASPLAFIFIAFGLMFFIPGYPVLCGAFFVTLGLFQSFQYAREANDVVFSALLPIAKRDVVKGRYLFVCAVELCAFLLMAVSALVRNTALADSEIYRRNALMNANCFALAMALVIFGLFNVIFVGSFFKTAYKVGVPFLVYGVAAFVTIGLSEALHWVPGLGALNAFGADELRLQLILLACGIAAYAVMTLLSLNKACRDFERIDL